MTWVPLLNKSIKGQNLEKPFEEHIDATLKGIQELKPDIVRALWEFQPEIGRRNNGLGQDGPTDVIWIISLLFIIRTIGMLELKALIIDDRKRIKENMSDCYNGI